LTYSVPSSIADTLESSPAARRSLLMLFLGGFLLESFGELRKTLDKLGKKKKKQPKMTYVHHLS